MIQKNLKRKMFKNNDKIFLKKLLFQKYICVKKLLKQAKHLLKSKK